jgi:hypothetical protein
MPAVMAGILALEAQWFSPDNGVEGWRCMMRRYVLLSAFILLVASLRG